jgi:hypothetical protein
MNMPAFTAEASIRKAGGMYSTASDTVTHPTEEKVISQQYLDCGTVATCVPPTWWCTDHCTDINGQLYTSGLYFCGFTAVGVPLTNLCVPGPSGPHFQVE